MYIEYFEFHDNAIFKLRTAIPPPHSEIDYILLLPQASQILPAVLSHDMFLTVTVFI